MNEGFRPTYWHVAWLEYRAHPWLGSGAGTFGDYWLRYGTPGLAGGALDAHNLYLETLAELGPVGLALLVATLAVPLVAALRVRRGRLVPAAVAAYATLLAHSALDWDWEMPAVMLVGLFCAAAIVACAREAPPAGKLSRRTQAGAFALAFALALFALLAQIS
jgi:O-antigen ligase